MQYYFVTQKEQQFILSDNDFHHLKNVMRMKENDHIVCIFKQKSYLCAIHYHKNSYTIEVIKELESIQELPIQIELYQALIKNDKFDFVIQKATEIGVFKIIPVICEHSIIKADLDKQQNKLQRYQKIIKEACEQSRRTFLPTITSFMMIKDIQLDQDTLGLVAFENEKIQHSLKIPLSKIHQYKKVAIVIGPEGGFSKNEITLLMNKGFQCVSLGSRILRSETAAIFACSVLAYHIENKEGDS